MYWCVVVSLNELLFFIYVSGYYNLFALIPCLVYVFKLVWIDPWFEAFFVLAVLMSDCCGCLGKDMFG
jgi:hypothetical protein